MPVDPNFLERLLLLRLNKGPAPILDLFGAASFETVCLTLDMGLFEELADHDRTVDDLAARLDADANGVRTLLGFLDAQGYVVEDDGRYRNTRLTSKWLTQASPTNMAPWLTFWNDLVFPFWDEQLETAIREGSPPRTIYEWFDEKPARWTTAQRGFRAAASILVDEVADKIGVPDGATRLLDVGGGHGLYTLELCRRYPALSAVVFDYPDALAIAHEEITSAGLSDRVSTQGGDYWAGEFGGRYDLALVFNVIHAHDGEENTRLFRKVADALDPGGKIVILDQLDGSARTPVGKTGLGFVGLTYLTTLGAETHPFDEVAEWLRAAGFENVRRKPIRRAGAGNSLVEATASKAVQPM